MKHIGLFEGIGGFSLATRWAGWETIAWCEINPFGQRVLRHHFPKATGHEDITKTDFTIYRGKCDILTGGFPCQGFSLAGKRMGTADARYLWPAMLRCIDETQPAWVVGENVTGLLSMEDRTGTRREVFAKVVNRKITRYCEVDCYEAVYTRQAKMLISSICEDLEERGYEVQTFAIPAAGVGAPHKRERVWIVAHANHTRTKQQVRVDRNGQAQGCKGGQRKPQPEFRQTGGNEVFANTQSTECARLSVRKKKAHAINGGASGNGAVTYADSQRHACQKHGAAESRQHTKTNPAEWWKDFPTQPAIRSRNDGFPGRLANGAVRGLLGGRTPRQPWIPYAKWRNESIKAMGNAIVPQVAYQIFKAINETEQ